VTRRYVVAVIGNNTATEESSELAEQIGREIVDRGYRLVTGGLGGIMEAASRGARSSARYREGDVIGILPGGEAARANVYVDIVLPTNLGHARNVLVVGSADAVVAVGGGAGTLTEIAMAWQLKKPVIALQVEGWSGRLAGTAIDTQRDDVVMGVSTASEAGACLDRLLAHGGLTPRPS
jgi:hypothetical protein